MTAATADTRPSFPQRAIVTSGMPYGNKSLHFGHIAGVFVPADAFARFMRDRIGANNVIFVSGTDCYGSPINEGYRKLIEESGFDGTIEDYVAENHALQKQALDAYGISLDIYEGSGLGTCKDVHENVMSAFIRRLYDNGYLEYRQTMQFYDPQAKTILNGRQVIGARCPVPGCKADHAYADECDLGHQYMPEDLEDPKSTITGVTPQMRPVGNWYFKLPKFAKLLEEHVDNLKADPEVRPIVPVTVSEFLAPPTIYVQEKFRSRYDEAADELPRHIFREAEKGKTSFGLEFSDVEMRDQARAVLDAHKVPYRAGKALVPFRITGNIFWGVPAPVIDGHEGLTVWCWPESLVAPVSFSIASIMEKSGLSFKDALVEARQWWCSQDAEIYQFIGQDNIYFYGVAQPAMWSALQQGHEPRPEAAPGEPRQTRLIANYHVLFMNKKASSSGETKPPLAAELLDHYTAEQLRIHFLSLGLALKPVSFSPKAYDPDAIALKEADREAFAKIADPVLKDGMVLTNQLNRMVRGAFYAAQSASGVTLDNEREGKVANGAQSFLPLGIPSQDLVGEARVALLEFERLMARAELHTATSRVCDYIRLASKRYNKECAAPKGENASAQQLIDAFFMARVCALLTHPIAPTGAEKIASYLGFTPESFFSWEGLLDEGVAGNEALCSQEELAAGRHAIKTLPPRTDFFSRHESQF